MLLSLYFEFFLFLWLLKYFVLTFVLSAPSSPLMAGIYLKVTSDFLPSSVRPRFRDKEPEIAVEKGDIIFDVRKLNDGWVYGKNLNTGKAGVFPASCTAKLSGSDDSDTGSDTGKETRKKATKDPAEEARRPLRRSSGSSQSSSGSSGRNKDPVVNGNDLLKEPGSKNRARDPADKTKFSRETSKSGTSQAPTSANLLKKQLSKPNIDPVSGKDKEKNSGSTDAKGFSDYNPVSKTTNPEDKSIRDTPARAQLFKLRPISSRIAEERMKENKKKEQERLVKEKEEKEKEKEKKEREKKEKEQKEKKEKERLEKERQEKKEREEREKRQKAKEKADDKQKLKNDRKPETDKTAMKAEDELYLNDSPLRKPQLAVNEEDVLDSEKPEPHYLNDEPTAVSVVHQGQSSADTSTTNSNIRIQENPLTKDDENIYQTPDLGKLPDKPRGGCDECHEPHDYEAPNHYKTPPGSPVNKKKKDKAKKKKKEKIKLGEMENKISDAKFADQRHKIASYESIRAGDFAKSSTESVKDAVKSVKKTTENLTTRRYPRLRIIGGITLGVLLGIICFLILYLVIFLAAVISAVVGFIVGFVAAIILGFLDRTRLLCVVLLIFPSLFSTGGKIAAWILITYFIIVGPICNIVGNVQLIAESRMCVILTTNNTFFNSSDKYFLSSRKNNIESRLQQNEKAITELESVLSESLLKMKDINKTASVNNYTGQHCSRAINESRITCLSDASLSFNTCAKTFSGSGKEIELRKKCQLFKAANICSPLLGEGMEQMCSSINLVTAKKTLIEANIIIEDLKRKLSNETLMSDHVLSQSKLEVCGFSVILTMLLPLLILLVLYDAFKYHKLYMSRDAFDNHYLTKHFKSIDELRKSSGTSDGLLPLKKGELNKYVRPTACQLAIVERKNLFKFLFIYLIYLLFALIFILFDYFFFLAITEGQKTFPINSRENGTAGTVVSGYLHECNIQLNPPSQWYVVVLSVLLGVLLLMILIQSHMLRLRRFVARRFYPRRERKRVAYLYYKILEERRSFVKAVIGRINSQMDEKETLKRLDVMLVLANHFHTMDWLFTTLRLGTKSCMVCGTSLNNKYIFCDNDTCEAVYCRTCFWDLENKCLGCMCGSKAASILSSDSFRRNDISV